MENNKKQKYDNYNFLTLSFTDFNGEKFINSLKKIINFYDENAFFKYTDLQNCFVNEYSDAASIRKVINTHIKLGLIESETFKPRIETYSLLKNVDNPIVYKTIFSSIVYQYSSFASSSTKNVERKKYSDIEIIINSIKFNNNLISKDDIGAFSSLSINDEKISKGYLTKDEIDEIISSKEYAIFKIKKKNQIEHLTSLINYLQGIYIVDNLITFKDDIDTPKSYNGRDTIKQSDLRNYLKKESEDINGFRSCFVEGVSYPTLFASHIKPYIDCDESEQFDTNNALLLSPSLDSLFNAGWITFDENWKIIFSKKCDESIKKIYNDYSIIEGYRNAEREEYLKYHRKNVYLNYE